MSSMPRRSARSLTKHCTWVFCGMPSADSTALPNSSPVRSTSSADRSPPAIAIFTSPLPCAINEATESPVPSSAPTPLIEPAPWKAWVAAISRATSRFCMRRSTFACTFLSPAGVRSMSLINRPLPTPKLMRMQGDPAVHHVQIGDEIIQRHTAPLDVLPAVAQVDVRPLQPRHADRRRREAASDWHSPSPLPAFPRASPRPWWCRPGVPPMNPLRSARSTSFDRGPLSPPASACR